MMKMVVRGSISGVEDAIDERPAVDRKAAAWARKKEAGRRAESASVAQDKKEASDKLNHVGIRLLTGLQRYLENAAPIVFSTDRAA